MISKLFPTQKHIVGSDMNAVIALAEMIPDPNDSEQKVPMWKPATLADLRIYIAENPTPTADQSNIIASGEDYRPTRGELYGHTARYNGKWELSQVKLTMGFGPGEISFLAVKN